MFHLGQEKVNFKFTLTFIELSLFDAGLKDVKVDDKDSKFLISWTRGSKKSDKTEPVEIQNSLLKWTKSFPISATLFREKKGDGFQKKVVNVNLVSLGKKGKSKTIGSGEINLAQYATEETEKIAKEIQSVLKIGKKPAMLKSLIECKNLKLSKSGDDELSEMSESKGVESGDEDQNTLESEGKSPDKRNSILKNPRSSSNDMSKSSNIVNLEVSNKILELQKKVRELEEENKKLSISTQNLSNFVQERDELRKKVKYLEDSLLDASANNNNNNNNNAMSVNSTIDSNKEIDNSQKLVEDLKKELEILKAEKIENQKQIQTLKEKFDNNNNEMIMSSNFNSKCEEKLENLQMECDELKEKEKASQKRLAELQMTLEQEMQKSKDKAKKMMLDYEKLMDDYDDLKAKLNSTNSLNNNNQALIPTQPSIVVTDIQQNQEMKERENVVTLQQQQLVDDVKKLKGEITLLEIREKSLVKKIEKLEGEKVNLQGLLEEKKKAEDKQQKAAFDKSAKVVDELNLKIDVMQKEKLKISEEHEKNIQLLEIRIEGLQKDLKEIQTVKEDQEKNYREGQNTMELENQRLLKQVAELKEVLLRKEETLSELMKQQQMKEKQVEQQMKENFEAKILEYENQLKSKDTEITQLKVKLQTQKRTSSVPSTTVINSPDKALQDELQTMKKMLHLLTDEKEHLENRVIPDQKKKLEDTLKQLKESHATMATEKREIVGQLDEMKILVVEKEKKLIELQKMIREGEGREAEKEKEIKQVKEELETLRMENDAFQSRLEEMSSNYANTQIEAAQTKADLSNQLTQYARRLEESVHETGKLETDVSALQQQLIEAKERESETLKNVHDEELEEKQRNVISSLEEEIQRLKMEVNNTNIIEEKTRREDNDNMAAQQQTEKAQEEILMLKTTIDKLEKDLSAVKEQFEATEAIRNKMQVEFLQLRADYDEKQEQYEALTTELKQKTEALFILQEENKKTTEKYKSLLQKQGENLQDVVNWRKMEHTERYLIDRFILFPNVNKVEVLFPTETTAALFQYIFHWNAFDMNTKYNLSLLENLVSSITFIVDFSTTNIIHTTTGLEASNVINFLLYWMNSLLNLLELLKEKVLGGDEQFRKILVTLNPRLFKNKELDSISHQNYWKSLVLLDKSSKPIRYDQKDTESLRDFFIKDIYIILANLYMKLLALAEHTISKQLSSLLFEKKQSENAAMASEAQAAPVIYSLNEYLTFMKKFQIPKKISVNFFEHLSGKLDGFIFNTMVQDTTFLSRAVQIKMFLSTLEQWFESKASVKKHPLFIYTRQASDVCIIANKSLLTDKTMRDAVCPDLTFSQLSKFLSITNASSSGTTKGSTSISSGSEDLTIQVNVDFFKATNPLIGVLDKEAPFIFDVAINISKEQIQENLAKVASSVSIVDGGKISNELLENEELSFLFQK